MSVYRYAGVNTRKIYSFATPLINAQGRPVVGGQYSVAFYNDEEVVYANNDGSVARGTAGATPTGYPYSASTQPSPYEMAIPSAGSPIEGPTLPAGLPFPLG